MPLLCTVETILSYSVTCLTLVFGWIQVLNKIKFIHFSFTIILYGSNVYVLYKNSFPTSRSWRYSPTLYPRSVTILPFTFRSIIFQGCQFCIRYKVGSVSQFPHMYVSNVPASLPKELVLSPFDATPHYVHGSVSELLPLIYLVFVPMPRCYSYNISLNIL